MSSPTYSLRRIGATATQAEVLALSNTLRPFFKGDPGTSTSEAQISADAGNILIPGSDGGLMVPGGDYDYEALVNATLPL